MYKFQSQIWLNYYYLNKVWITLAGPWIFSIWHFLLLYFRSDRVSSIRGVKTRILGGIMAWIRSIWFIKDAPILDVLSAITQFNTFVIVSGIEWWSDVILQWWWEPILVAKCCFVASPYSCPFACHDILGNVVECVATI